MPKMRMRPTPSQQKEFKKIFSFAEKSRLAAGVPGLSLGILHDGAREMRGLGVSDIVRRDAVLPTTLFQIGSITKTFIATTLMRLRERGEVDLDAPIARLLPGLRLPRSDARSRITLRHILTHTAGWAGDYFDDTGRGDDALEKILPALRKLPQLVAPGTLWAYNNAGFYIAGRIIENLTGLPIEKAIEREIFRPLGLRESFFFTEDIVTHRFALGHHVRDGKASVATPWGMCRSTNALGGIVTNVCDLLRYAQVHMELGFLKAESLEEMQRVQTDAGCGIDAMGLGWCLRRVGDLTAIFHNGITNGQVALLSIIPEKRFALAMLTNANTGLQIIWEIERFALQGLFNATPSPRSETRLAPPSLEEYPGDYEAQLNRATIRIEGHRLMMYSKAKMGFPKPDSPPLPSQPSTRLSFFARDKVFIPPNGGPSSEGEFLRGPDGHIRWFRFAGRLHRRRQ